MLQARTFSPREPMVNFSSTALGQGLEVWAKRVTQKSLGYKPRELSLRESNRMGGFRDSVSFKSGRKDQREELKVRPSREAWDHSLSRKRGAMHSGIEQLQAVGEGGG